MHIDTFTGAAGDLASLPADITGQIYTALTGDGALSRSGSGTIYSVTASKTGWYYSAWTPPSTDYQSLTVVKKFSNTSQAVGTMHRVAGGPGFDAMSCYLWQWYQGTGLFYIYKFVNNVFTQLGSTFASGISDGDEVRFSVTGSSTTTLTLWLNGSQILTTTDSSSPLTAAGKFGVRLYTDVTGVTNAGYHLDSVQAYALIPEYSQGVVLANGHAEIAWDRIPGASLYTVYRAASTGGSFSSIGMASPPTLYYEDAGYSAANVYKVTATLDSVESAKSAEITPSPVATVDDSISGRHSVVTDGTFTQLARYDNAYFKLTANVVQSIGPVSTATLFNDSFTAGSPQATLTSGTQNSCGGGSISISATASNWAVLRYGTHLSAPNFAVVGEFTSTNGDAMVGLGTDATHGVFARYKADHHIDIFGVNGAGETSIKAAISHTFSGSFKLALEVGNLVFHCWYDDGSGWVLAGCGFVSSGSTYDLQTPATLAAWYPLVAAGNGAGTTTTVLTNQRAVGYGGSGGVREVAPITDPSGKPIQRTDGKYLVCADRCGPVPKSGINADSDIGNVTSNVCFSVHAYDPVGAPGDLGPPIGSISLPAHSKSMSGQDGKVVYEPGVGMHCFVNDWSNAGSAAFPSLTAVYYQLVSATPDTFKDFIHLGSAAAITLPSGFPGATYTSFYGVDALKINGTWYLVGTHSDVINHAFTTVLSGSAPDSYSTLVAEDTSLNAEGTSFWLFGDRIYILAGLLTGGGTVEVYDFTDLATLVELGLLNYANPMSHNVLAQQPAILAYKSGSQTIHQFLGFDDETTSVYADYGPVVAFDLSLKLQGLQWNDGNRRRRLLCGGLA